MVMGRCVYQESKKIVLSEALTNKLFTTDASLRVARGGQHFIFLA
jgi:hypothetical protein